MSKVKQLNPSPARDYPIKLKVTFCVQGVLSTLLGVGSQITFGSNNSELVQAIRESTQESTNQAGQQFVEKDLNIQPTIAVRQGWPLRVVIHKVLVLKPYLE